MRLTTRPCRFSIGACPNEAQLRRLAVAFAEKLGFGLGRRCVRVVGARLAVEIALAITPGGDGGLLLPSLAPIILSEPHASMSVPSTEK
jgi:hypothetical protein